MDIREEGGEEIQVKPVNLPMGFELVVKRDGQVMTTTKDVLVCFSLLDLGIEVVKVKEYEIKQSDYMLDGETQPGSEPGSRELVRMPMVLMSEAYLRKTFSRADNWPNYTDGVMPSVTVEKPPDEQKREIILFKYDVARRIELLRTGEATDWEKRRIQGWLDEFASNFLDCGVPSIANPSRRFVPATAKLLNLFFSTSQ